MAETMSYTSIRNARLAKETEEQKTILRKRNLLVFIFDYLLEMGYTNTCQALESEVQFELNQYVACDNIDLDTILQEFESYYFIRFQKYPKLVKRITEGSDSKKKVLPLKYTRKSKDATIVNTSVNDKIEPHRRAISCLPNLNSSSKSESKESQDSCSNSDFNLVGQSIHKVSNTTKPDSNEKEPQLDPSFRLLKPLGGFCYNAEWKELAEIISQDIYQENPNVHWDDIIGQDQAKHLIKEAVVYPIKYPQLFTGILSPWKGILLYGPPGTGKTMLAKALATECKTTFFNISASTIVSKWRGDSEKLVRIMFELARYHAPSTIFLDELDSLMSHRQSGLQSSEHEGSRRMKTEILIQMDGLARSDDLVFLLAASNIPWELDYAMLRRLEKRILVDLPNDDARTALFHHYLPPVICSKGGLHFTSDLDYQYLSTISEGYSGADIQLVCKEAAMQRMRKVIELLEYPGKGKEVPSLEGIKTEEVESALERTKPSAKNLAQKYFKWKNTFGSS